MNAMMLYRMACARQSKPWEVATARYSSKSFDVSGQSSSTADLFFKSDGTKMYILGYSNDTVYQYSLT